MSRRLSETQKRLWAQAGEMLRQFVAVAAVPEDLPASAPEMVAPAAEVVIVAATPAAVETLDEIFPAAEHVDPPAAVAIVDAVPALIEPVVLPPSAAEWQPEPPIIEEVSPASLGLHDLAPARADDVAPPVSLVAPARAPAPDWRESAHLPAADFFATLHWSKNVFANGAAPEAKRAGNPVFAGPEIDPRLSSLSYFSTAIPWQGRGQKPLAGSAPVFANIGALPSLSSMMSAATGSALHTARKLSAGGRGGAGSANVFFSKLSWQRQPAAS